MIKLGKEENLFELIQAHHFSFGETLIFNCPHCGKEIVIELKALEGDPDTIEVFWGKNFNEIEEKRKKVEEEAENDP